MEKTFRRVSAEWPTKGRGDYPIQAIKDDEEGKHILLGAEDFATLTERAADGMIAKVGYEALRELLNIMFQIDDACTVAWYKACEMRMEKLTKEQNEHN